VLARDGVPVARLRFDERLRDDARAAVQALREDGVAVRLLSGDTAQRGGPSGRRWISPRRAVR
jgi:Cu2+-exporting ATPase